MSVESNQAITLDLVLLRFLDLLSSLMGLVLVLRYWVESRSKRKAKAAISLKTVAEMFLCIM